MPAFSIPERNIEYTGWSWETLQENMWPQFTVTTGQDGSKESFQTVFGVLFPACIGILAGKISRVSFRRFHENSRRMRFIRNMILT